MRGVNKVILVATAGSDPEVRYMPNGAAVANVSLATNESWTDKQTGQKQERTEWHRVVFMDRGNYRLGQIAGDFIKKGSKVYVEGSLRTREWEKDGIKRYSTEIVASELQLLDSRQDDQQGQGQPQGGYGQNGAQGQNWQQSAPQQQPQAQPQSYGSWGGGNQANGYGQASGGTTNRQPPPQQQAPSMDDFEDDIPF